MTDQPDSHNNTMAAAEVAFFQHALSTFVKSTATFQVVCTVRSSSRNAAAAPLAPLAPPTRPRSPVRTLLVLDSSFNPPTVAHMQMAVSAIHDRRKSQERARQQGASADRLLLLLSVNNADKAPKPAAFEQRLALMLAMAKDMHRALDDATAEAGPPPPAVASTASGSTSPPPAAVATGSDLAIDIGLTSQPYFHDKSSAIAASDFYASDAVSSASGPTQTPEQVFLVGYDTLVRIFDPKYYAPAPPATVEAAGLSPGATPLQVALTPFLRRARLRVTTRPDDQWGSEDAQEGWLQAVGKLSGGGGGGDVGEDWTARIDIRPGAYRGEATVSSTMARAAAREKVWPRLGLLVGPAVLSWIKRQQLYSE
ncbi:Rossmann-like alpha/beta/alpha sandwich fold protein [Niveomyces insectorum RCEF 264]|uniref:Rossmann-like alpha/beta/alpha sandwich fold protein n=1 Tax=Niveomyces insectorum RCEF 264 TaxID=1081102 RepID=A0A167YX05_9HYPO|nr:Rossmann-like alpha/beta/alpha sandwich fold protein [Niveomyces insectorum RCEF 264]